MPSPTSSHFVPCPRRIGPLAYAASTRANNADSAGSPKMKMAVVSLTPGIGMVAIGCVSIWFWRRVSREPARWFWIGAALWAVAVALKVAIAVVSNATVIGFMNAHL